MDVEIYRDALMRKRGELLGGHAAKPLQWTMENNSGRQGDMADQASGNNEVHIQLKLKQTDAKILQAIEEALRRIDAGHLRRLPRLRRADRRGRLKAIPWTRSASPARKSRRRDDTAAGRSPEAPHRLRRRTPGAPAAPRSRRPRGQPLRFQQHLPVRHQPRGDALSWLQNALGEFGAAAAAGRRPRCRCRTIAKQGKKVAVGAFRAHPRGRRAAAGRVRRALAAAASRR